MINFILLKINFYFQVNGNDNCSCITGNEDCSSERVRFDDNVSFIACNSPYTDKASIGSACSMRIRAKAIEKSTRTSTEPNLEDISNDSICIDISGGNLLSKSEIEEDKPKKMSASEILRNVLLRFTPAEVKMESQKKSDSNTDLSTDNVTEVLHNAHSSNVTFKTVNKSVYVENSSL